MSTTSVTSFSELFWAGWHAWKHLFQTMPLWDPYGATFSLALVVALLGYTVKNVMD